VSLLKVMKEKRGLSPVVATTLLVGVVIILGVIIFFWARTVLPEIIYKESVNIKQFCDDTDFSVDAEMSGTSVNLTIINRGTVPIFGFSIREVGVGGTDDLGFAKFEDDSYGISPGQTARATLDPGSGSSIEDGDTLFIAPILLGETDTEKRPHPCDDEYGDEVVVGG